MEELNLKVFFTKSGMYFVGNQKPGLAGTKLTFNWLFMLLPQQGGAMAMAPFGMNMAKEDVEVNGEEIVMIADAVDELKKDYTDSIGKIKAQRAGIVLAPANAMSAMPKKADGRADVAKLI